MLTYRCKRILYDRITEPYAWPNNLMLYGMLLTCLKQISWGWIWNHNLTVIDRAKISLCLIAMHYYYLFTWQLQKCWKKEKFGKILEHCIVICLNCGRWKEFSTKTWIRILSLRSCWKKLGKSTPKYSFVVCTKINVLCTSYLRELKKVQDSISYGKGRDVDVPN